MKRLSLVLSGLFLFLFMVLFSACFMLTDLLLYRDRGKAGWMKQEKAACNGWLANQAFADLRGGGAENPGNPLDFSCEQALSLPATDHEVTGRHGLAIHYKVFDNPSVVASVPVARANTEESSEVPLSPPGVYPTNAPNALAPLRPLWLHVHGINGNTLHGARYYNAATRLGFQMVALDLTNHALSGNNGKGAAYGCRENEDVRAVVADLTTRFPDRGILLSASSMGAMAALNAAPALAEPELANHLLAIALENPIPSVRKIVQESPQAPKLPGVLFNLALWVANMRAGYDFDECRPVDRAREVVQPVLVQQAAQDELVPESQAREVFAALPQSELNLFKLYPKGRHSTVWNGNPVEFEGDLRLLWANGLKRRALTSPP